MPFNLLDWSRDLDVDLCTMIMKFRANYPPVEFILTLYFHCRENKHPTHLIPPISTFILEIQNWLEYTKSASSLQLPSTKFFFSLSLSQIPICSNKHTIPLDPFPSTIFVTRIRAIKK